MKDKNRLAQLLRILISNLEALNEQQIDQLLAGKARLTVTAIKKAKVDVGGFSRQSLLDLVGQLNRVRDRSEARQILDSVASRDALAALARALKVHTVKHDRREDIESKIVEFVIGGKLRSEAIRSLNLKAGGGSRSNDEIEE
jgi:hypothetical protein